MPPHRYVLDGREPVPCDDLLAWALWFETAERHLARTELPGGAYVSTVFLGMDHNFAGRASGRAHVPVLFETLVFGGDHDGLCERTATWAEAEAAHAAMVALCS